MCLRFLFSARNFRNLRRPAEFWSLCYPPEDTTCFSPANACLPLLHRIYSDFRNRMVIPPPPLSLTNGGGIAFLERDPSFFPRPRILLHGVHFLAPRYPSSLHFPPLSLTCPPHPPVFRHIVAGLPGAFQSQAVGVRLLLFFALASSDAAPKPPPPPTTPFRSCLQFFLPTPPRLIPTTIIVCQLFLHTDAGGV